MIENGKVLDQNMRRMRYNLDELNSHLRTCGFFDIDHVEYAILEPSGHLSVRPKSQHRPLTPADLKLPTQYEGLSIELILDGRVIHPNLDQNRLTESWRTLDRSVRRPDPPTRRFRGITGERLLALPAKVRPSGSHPATGSHRPPSPDGG